MKTITKIAILAASLTAAFPLMNAAEASSPAPSSDTTMNAAAANHPKSHAPLQHRRALAQRITRKLNLNESQVTQLKTIRESTHTTLKTIRANTGLTSDQKKTQIREALNSSHVQMRAALTPEQQAKLEEMKTRAWERHGGF